VIVPLRPQAVGLFTVTLVNHEDALVLGRCDV